MNDRQIRVRLWIVLVLLFVSGILFLSLFTSGAEHTDYLEVHYLDVGQGDATFIETPDDVQVLIDGGPNSAVLRELGKHMSIFDRSIDVLIATHPDSDHIGGLVDVLRRYKIKTIVLTNNGHSTPVTEALARAIENEGADVLYVNSELVLRLGSATALTILFPLSDATEMESNMSSIIAQLHYGKNSFLFTGDAPKSIEYFLVSQYGPALQSDVLKVGHHGSKTSTASEFVFVVEPAFAVISAGKNNRYGHPHQSVLDILGNIPTVSTYDDGTITFLSDGEAVWRK